MKELGHEGSTITIGPYGPRLSVRGPWRPEYRDLFSRREIVDLDLNYAKGWQGRDVDFLHGLTNLLCLTLFALWPMRIAPIQALVSLKELQLSVTTEDALDFAAFTDLREFFVRFVPAHRSLFNSSSITNLAVDGYSDRSASQFGRMSQLEHLQIVDCTIYSVGELSLLKRVRSLRLASVRRLATIAGVGEMSALETLWIQGFRNIGDISGLAGLENLTSIDLDDCGKLSSLAPLLRLPKLQSVMFLGNTLVEDGDISSLLTLPSLTQVKFANRPHYNMSLTILSEALERRKR